MELATSLPFEVLTVELPHNIMLQHLLAVIWIYLFCPNSAQCEQ